MIRDKEGGVTRSKLNIHYLDHPPMLKMWGRRASATGNSDNIRSLSTLHSLPAPLRPWARLRVAQRNTSLMQAYKLGPTCHAAEARTLPHSSPASGLKPCLGLVHAMSRCSSPGIKLAKGGTLNNMRSSWKCRRRRGLRSVPGGMPSRKHTGKFARFSVCSSLDCVPTRPESARDDTK